MSQNIQRFGVDQVNDTRRITHLSDTPFGLGLGVSSKGKTVFQLANGSNAYGIVMQCEPIGKSYLITLCTLAERLAVRLKEGENPENGAPLLFENGELVELPQDSPQGGAYFLQEIEESYFIEDGSSKRAAQIRFS